jgi:hemerythrin
MSLVWNDAYNIGNGEIDAQHQRMFSHINDFLSAKNKAAELFAQRAVLIAMESAWGNLAHIVIHPILTSSY